MQPTADRTAAPAALEGGTTVECRFCGHTTRAPASPCAEVATALARTVAHPFGCPWLTTREQAALRVRSATPAPAAPAPGVEASMVRGAAAGLMIAVERDAADPDLVGKMVSVRLTDLRGVAPMLTALAMLPGSERDAALSAIFARLGAAQAKAGAPQGDFEFGLGNCPERRDADPLAFDGWVTAYNIAEHMRGEVVHQEDTYLQRLAHVARESVITLLRMHYQPADPARATLAGAVRDYLVAMSKWEALYKAWDKRTRSFEVGSAHDAMTLARSALDAALAAEPDAGDGWERITDDTPLVDDEPWIVGHENTDVVGEARWREGSTRGAWWWANESEGDYYAEPITPQPTHRRPLPAPPAPRTGREA